MIRKDRRQFIRDIGLTAGAVLLPGCILPEQPKLQEEGPSEFSYGPIELQANFGEYQVVYCEPSTMRPGAPKGLWGLTVQATMHSRFESSQQIYGKRIGNESEGRCEKHFETTSHPQTYDKDFQVRLSYDLIDSNDNGRLDLVMARMELYLSDTFVDYDIHFSGRVNNGKVDLEQEPAYHLSHLDAVITSFDPEKDENLAEFGITDLFESTGLPIFNILKDPKQVREMLAAKLTLDYPVLNGYYQSQRAQAEER